MRRTGSPRSSYPRAAYLPPSQLLLVLAPEGRGDVGQNRTLRGGGAVRAAVQARTSVLGTLYVRCVLLDVEVSRVLLPRLPLVERRAELHQLCPDGRVLGRWCCAAPNDHIFDEVVHLLLLRRGGAQPPLGDGSARLSSVAGGASPFFLQTEAAFDELRCALLSTVTRSTCPCLRARAAACVSSSASTPPLPRTASGSAERRTRAACRETGAPTILCSHSWTSVWVDLLSHLAPVPTKHGLPPCAKPIAFDNAEENTTDSTPRRPESNSMKR